jgi:3-isopropylmalate/(R)-2-methylmalate dehydratase small subunit
MVLAEELPAAEIVVDLKTQSVSTTDGWSRKFEIHPFVRQCLLEGLDDIGLTLRNEDSITTFEAKRDSERFPTTAGLA